MDIVGRERVDRFFLSELGNTFNFKIKFVLFWPGFLLREHFYIYSITTHTCVCQLLIYSSSLSKLRFAFTMLF
jgi:hypothetical protein